MARYPSEAIRITPLMVDFSTAGGTSLECKTRITTQGDFSVLMGIRCSTLATGITSTAAMNYDWSVIEATAATAGGSVITGATITLGAATAFTLRGGVNCILKVGTACGTADGVIINGIQYNGTAVGATASNGGNQIARAINGYGTSQKLPHYTAVSNYGAKDQVLITADDDMGTGLTVTCTAGSGCAARMSHLMGVIDIQGSKLSTNTPKYIGVGCTSLTGDATSIRYAQLISYPRNRPGMPGVKVSCTT
jgi:hypothetical protein